MQSTRCLLKHREITTTNKNKIYIYICNKRNIGCQSVVRGDVRIFENRARRRKSTKKKKNNGMPIKIDEKKKGRYFVFRFKMHCAQLKTQC